MKHVFPPTFYYVHFQIYSEVNNITVITCTSNIKWALTTLTLFYSIYFIIYLSINPQPILFLDVFQVS